MAKWNNHPHRNRKQTRPYQDYREGKHKAKKPVLFVVPMYVNDSECKNSFPFAGGVLIGREADSKPPQKWNREAIQMHTTRVRRSIRASNRSRTLEPNHPKIVQIIVLTEKKKSYLVLRVMSHNSFLVVELYRFVFTEMGVNKTTKF